METYSKDVFVFIEQNNGKPADVSFELLSKENSWFQKTEVFKKFN